MLAAALTDHRVARQICTAVDRFAGDHLATRSPRPSAPWRIRTPTNTFEACCVVRYTNGALCRRLDSNQYWIGFKPTISAVGLRRLAEGAGVELAHADALASF